MACPGGRVHRPSIGGACLNSRSPTPVRCAIYTRKSHDERPDAQLGSCQRQRELCELYVASQAEQGWIALPDRFDDPGWSGGTLKRPALARLLAAIDAGTVDAVVFYKLDRLSRSTRHWFELAERLDRAGVTLVSATQPIASTGSTGRLLLGMLLVIAQFERELTGERSRDWKAGARERGLWTSGPPPFGYRVVDLHLEPDPAQAPAVVWLFMRLPTVRCYATLATVMNELGFRNRQRRPFEGRHIKRIVTSRTYLGELPHAGGWLPGRHAAIVTPALWAAVQSVVAALAAPYARGEAAAGR